MCGVERRYFSVMRPFAQRFLGCPPSSVPGGRRSRRRPCDFAWRVATWGGGIYSIPRFRGRPAGIASLRRCGNGTGCAACRSLRSWSVFPCRGQSLLGLYRLSRAVGLKELGEGNLLRQGNYGGDGCLTCKDVKAMERVLTDLDTRQRLSTLSGHLCSPLLRWIRAYCEQTPCAGLVI